MAVVNLMWFGNVPVLSSSTTSNATPAQASTLVGHVATGKEQIKAVAVDGSPVTSNAFIPSYTSGTKSVMTYTSPHTDQPVTVQIRAFLNATYSIEIMTDAGVRQTLTQTGRVLQMSNGDIFFRPIAGQQAAWDNVKSVISVTITAAGAEGSGISAIGFPVTIFDKQIVCFARGTMIATASGERPIESLAIGDLVMTKDNGLQAIRWIGATPVTARELDLMPNLRPIRIAAGALGEGLPSADLTVSPQHRILVSSKIAQRMFGADEVLVAAKQLIAIDGIDVVRAEEGVEYFHMLFDRHEIVLSNGAETESLLAGALALDHVGAAARDEILSLFPELANENAAPARLLPLGREGRRLAQRQQANEQALVRH